MKFWKRNFDLLIVGAVILGLGCAYIITPPYVLPALACCEGEDGCDSCEWAVQIDPPTLSCGDQEITLRGTANYCSEDASIEVYLNDAEIYASDEKPESWEATINVQAGKQYEVDAVVYDGDEGAAYDNIKLEIPECAVPEPEPKPEPEPSPEEPPRCTDCRPSDAPTPPDLPTPAEFRGGEGGEEEIIEPEEIKEVLPAQVKPAAKKTLPQTGGWTILDLFYAGWAYGGYRMIKRIWRK